MPLPDFEEPRYIIASPESKAPAIDIMEKLLSMDFNTYRDICLKCYRAVEETYGIDKIMRSLLKKKPSTMDAF